MMKYKSVLLFVLLAAIIVSVNIVSCHKYEKESDDYSEWMVMTEIDSVIYALTPLLNCSLEPEKA